MNAILNRFRDVIRVEIHGGEPFLAPIENLYEVWKKVSPLWPNIHWSCSTNLTYNLTEEHLKFFKEVFTKGFCTSWDKSIRFSNQKQEDLWRENLRTLVNEGHNITLNVSLNRELLEMNTDELVNWLNTLGVNYVQFERLTYDGSALQNMDIFPLNIGFFKIYRKLDLGETPEMNDLFVGFRGHYFFLFAIDIHLEFLHSLCAGR